MDIGGGIGGVGGAISDFGAAYGDFQAAKGSKAAAGSFLDAAKLEDENSLLARTSGDIEQAQLGRQLYGAQSGIQAGAAGNGLKLSGSGQDVLRASAIQGGIAAAKIGAQTEINVDSFKAQAGAYRNQAQQELALSKSQKSSGWMSALAGVASIAMIAA